MSEDQPLNTSAAPDTADGAPGDRYEGELSRITRATITIYKEQFGRGPRNAHSYYAGPDTITCMLEGTMTPVERTLVAVGEQHRVQDIRQLFQSAAEQRFRASVEEITGRRVVTFMSGNDVTGDVASEIFGLERQATTTVAATPTT
jgi:uncharacterized protein YbcI